MHRGQKGRRLPLKTVYYLSFLFFIVIPILVVLVVALLALNKQFKNQALTNIPPGQEEGGAGGRAPACQSIRSSILCFTLFLMAWAASSAVR